MREVAKVFVICLVLLALTSGTMWGQTSPLITLQPVSQTVNAGQSVTFSVAGTGVSNYYWFLNGVLIDGAASSSYTFTAEAEDTGGRYFAFLRSADGENLQSNTAILSVVPRTNVPTVTTVENFGTVPASRVASGFGLNVSPTVDWQFSACALIGCKWVRFDCIWSQTEIQQMPSNTSGGYALPQNCGAGLQSSSTYGLHPDLSAYWGPPYTQIATATTAQDTPAGSYNITISHLTSGSLAGIVGGKTTLTTNIGIGTPTAVALYEGGALVTEVSGNVLTLARATQFDIPAGSLITVSALLYPPILFARSTSNTAYMQNSSLKAFDNYLHFLATSIVATGSMGTVELWNEPEQNGECWDYAPNCYDAAPAHSAIVEGSGIALALSAMTIPPVPGVKYGNGWTDTNGAQSLYDPYYAPYFAVPPAQANEAYAWESFHVYGNMPEQTNWIPACLLLNSPGPLNISFACTPIGDDPSSNFKYAASLNLYPSAAGGIHQAITETGVCRTCYSPEPSENAVTRFDLRQFIASQGNGISPVIFYQANGNNYLGDNPTFEWFHEDQTPYPVATAFKSFMSDINAISAAPVGFYSTLMPLVTSFKGYYPLAIVSFVGTKPGSTSNSVIYLSWQKTYTVPPKGSSGSNGSAPPWIQMVSPTAVSETIAIWSGYSVSSVRDLVTQKAIPFTVANRKLSFMVADNPIEVILTP